MRWLRPTLILLSTVLLILALIGVMPFATSTLMPDSKAYFLKPASENVLVAVLPGQKLKQASTIAFASRRITEAAYLGEQLVGKPTEEQVASVSTINGLLETYLTSVESLTPILKEGVRKTELSSQYQRSLDSLQSELLVQYKDLVKLKLDAPISTQAGILKAIESLQENLTLVDDIHRQPPVSEMDLDQFSIFVTSGLITKEELVEIAQSKTNQEFYESVKRLVITGHLPASALYALQYDNLQKYLPDDLAQFKANVELDELRKILLMTRSIEPNAAIQQESQIFLSNYNVGVRLPRDASTPYTAPLVYGLNLSANIDEILDNVDESHLSPTRNEIYSILKSISTDGLTTKEVFEQILDASETYIPRDAALLNHVDLEVLDALQKEVTYLALPPGWTQDVFADNIPLLRSQKVTIEESAAAKKQMQELSKLIDDANDILSQNVSDNDELKSLAIDIRILVQGFLHTLVQDAHAQTTTNQDSFDKKLDLLRKEISTLIDRSNLQDNENEQTKNDLKSLYTSVDATLAKIAEINTKLTELTTAQKIYQEKTEKQLQSLINSQNITNSKLDQAITSAQQNGQNLQTLQTSLQTFQTQQQTQQANFQQQIDSQQALLTSLQQEFLLVTIDHSNQIALIQQAISNLGPNQSADIQALQDAIVTLQNNLDTTRQDLLASYDQLNSRLQLFINTTIIAHEELSHRVDALTLDITDIESIVNQALADQASIEQTLAAQDAELKTLETSLATLQQNQVQIQQQIAGLSSDVTNIQVSLTVIETNQASAQAQIDELNRKWATLPPGMQFDKTLFDNAKQDLQVYYQSLVNQLDQQYQQYHLLLQDDLSKLRQETDQQILRLEQKATQLEQALKQAASGSSPGNSGNSGGNPHNSPAPPTSRSVTSPTSAPAKDQPTVQRDDKFIK